ncbi:hypothetical protein SDC9_160981 [bioreactor metagenome]|uniref:Uncharacterized protein n=1 Tax=bioreactor metagenome TaxID=1076179 RepID=A0A645FGY3_9ZZZZ
MDNQSLCILLAEYDFIDLLGKLLDDLIDREHHVIEGNLVCFNRLVVGSNILLQACVHTGLEFAQEGQRFLDSLEVLIRGFNAIKTFHLLGDHFFQRSEICLQGSRNDRGLVTCIY